MRGTWQGSGTFETSDDWGWLVKVAVIALAAVEVIEWVAARIWWLLTGTVVVIGVPVLACVLLVRAQQRREAVHAAEHPFVHYRAPEVPAVARPQIAPRVTVNQYFYGPDAAEMAPQAIRNMLPGKPGAVTNQEE